MKFIRIREHQITHGSVTIHFPVSLRVRWTNLPYSQRVTIFVYDTLVFTQV